MAEFSAGSPFLQGNFCMTGFDFIRCGACGASVWPVRCFWYVSLTYILQYWRQLDMISGAFQKGPWRPIVLLCPWWSVHLFIQETQCPLDPVLCQDWLQETVVLTICSLQPRPCSAATSSFPVSLCLHQRSLGRNIVLNRSPRYSAQYTGHNYDLVLSAPVGQISRIQLNPCLHGSVELRLMGFFRRWWVWSIFGDLQSVSMTFYETIQCI